jgi:putative endonuclease
MLNNSQNLGIEGEEIARKHLLKKGYEILDINWRFKKLEIDIISKQEDTIVFVEVKTRSNDVFGDPEVFVTKKKQKFLVAAAHQYLVERNIELEARFDIVSVLFKNGKFEVNQLESAFYPTAV